MSEDNNINSENAVNNEIPVDNGNVAGNENMFSNDSAGAFYGASDSFNTVTGPVNEAKKPKRSMKPVIAVVAMLAIVAMAAGVFFFSKSALGKNGHIITALKNTFATVEADEDEPTLDKLLEAGKCAIDLQVSVDGAELAVSGNIDRSAKQMSLSGSWSDGNSNLGLLATIDDTYFKFTIPGYINGTFEYNFTAENTGYFANLITQSTGMDIAEFNKIFLDCFNMPESQVESSDEQYTNMLLDDFNELDFEKVDKKDFRVAGETKSCKGYKAVITKEILEKWIDNYKELDIVNPAMASNLAIIKQSLAAFTQFSFTVYIADDKAAAIEIEYEGEILAIKFEGQENPLHDIVITDMSSGENDEIRIVTTKENSDTKFVVTVMGEEYISASYNSESGKTSVTFADDTFGFEGTYKNDENGLELVIDELNVEGEILTGMFKISDDITLETIDSGLPVVDFGNATEEELQTFMMDNMDLNGMLSLFGTDSDDELYDDSLDGYDYDDFEDYDLEDYEDFDWDDLEGEDI